MTAKCFSFGRQRTSGKMQRFDYEGSGKKLMLGVLIVLLGIFVYYIANLYAVSHAQREQERIEAASEVERKRVGEEQHRLDIAKHALPAVKKNLLDVFPGSKELTPYKAKKYELAVSSYPVAFITGNLLANDAEIVLFIESRPTDSTIQRLALFEDHGPSWRTLLEIDSSGIKISGKRVTPERVFPQGPRSQVLGHPGYMEIIRGADGRLAIQNYFFAGTLVEVKWDSEKSRFVIRECPESCEEQ